MAFSFNPKTFGEGLTKFVSEGIASFLTELQDGFKSFLDGIKTLGFGGFGTLETTVTNGLTAASNQVSSVVAPLASRAGNAAAQLAASAGVPVDNSTPAAATTETAVADSTPAATEPAFKLEWNDSLDIKPPAVTPFSDITVDNLRRTS